MHNAKKLRQALLLPLLTFMVGALISVFQTSAFAQCTRPSFKITDGFSYDSMYAGKAAAADFSSDGKIDVAIINAQNSTVSIAFGDGHGKLSSSAWYIVGPALLTNVVAKDVNNDTKPDLIIIGETGQFASSVSILLNNGTGGFGSPVTSALGNNVFNHQVADMNGDNKADLITSTFDVLQVRLGDGSGHFLAPATTSIPHLNTLQVGDFNGDNKIDVAVELHVSPSNNEVRQYLNNGAGGFTIGSPTDSGINSAKLLVATDFNGDSKLDLAGASGVSHAISVFLNNGSGGFVRTEYPSIADRFVVGDFDGNGRSDLLSYSYGFGPWPYMRYTTSLLVNDGSGGFSRTDYKGIPVFIESIAADFNNDGKSDLLTSADGVSNWSGQVWINQCNYSLSTKRVDYDGDGLTDLAVWRPSTGEWIIKQTDGGVVRTQQWGGGSFGDIPVPGDYDGDGKSDLAVFRDPTGDWWIYKSSDNTSLGVHWGASGDKPVPGDYDADGKTDVAVFRPATGGWFIFRSSDSTMDVAFFGTIGDKPVQADYDNDDKADVAVFRPSNGYWYILKSSDGSFNYTHFGISGDKPIPGDYDADGKADIAVFRPNEAWYFLQSSNGTFQGIVWLQNQTPTPGSYSLQGLGTAKIATWNPTDGVFHMYLDSGTYGLGASGDIPVTTPYVIE